VEHAGLVKFNLRINNYSYYILFAIMARVEIIVGCMFSGKSTELIRRISRYKAIDKDCLVINSSLDTRTEGASTHSGTHIRATHVSHLMELTDKQEYRSASVIGIDEAQFFSDLVEFVYTCEKDDKILIIAGLDGTSERKPFGHIHECLCLCESITKLTAMDMISKDSTLASFTKRIIPISDSTIDIGGTDKYIAVSRKNFLTN